MNRTFDLVVSLEVAEHLFIQYTEVFVDSLTRLGPVVVFSAAMPRQSGAHHVNEQFPNYWAKLFEKRKYVTVDPIRQKIFRTIIKELFFKSYLGC